MNFPICIDGSIVMLDHIVKIDIGENYKGTLFLDDGSCCCIDLKPWVKNNNDLSYEDRFMDAFNRMVYKAFMSCSYEFAK